ncbi:hypothetical protein [Streptomyces sp. NBC_00120]|uniref:Uncharacterized protein n=1 Tax=Streptomyces sp. NBC_00119 TaxID=2975659 RepID=A0AAU1UPD6_9ACTN|nr:hypothetical protein [Streptomyces sp. NBC_00120]MCX5321814.1 hypothetical protein [Streptomyces sp. NBC_00120]
MGNEIAVPAKYRVRPHQQPHPTHHLPWQAMEEGRQESPVARVEPNLLPVQLPFQNAELMAQGQDLYIFLTVARRHQAQYRERVRHTQVRQSQQHD